MTFGKIAGEGRFIGITPILRNCFQYNTRKKPEDNLRLFRFGSYCLESPYGFNSHCSDLL